MSIEELMAYGMVFVLVYGVSEEVIELHGLCKCLHDDETLKTNKISKTNFMELVSRVEKLFANLLTFTTHFTCIVVCN